MKYRIQQFFLHIGYILLSIISAILTWQLLRRRRKNFRKSWDLNLESGASLCWNPDLTQPDASAVNFKIHNAFGNELISAHLYLDEREEVRITDTSFRGERIVGLQGTTLMPAPQKHLTKPYYVGWRPKPTETWRWMLKPKEWKLQGYIPKLWTSDIKIEACFSQIPCDDGRFIIDSTITARSKLLYDKKWCHTIVFGLETLKPITIESKVPTFI